MDILGLPLLIDVLYIKGLKVNLLSITQICDKDFLVQFSKKRCLIYKLLRVRCSTECPSNILWLY